MSDEVRRPGSPKDGFILGQNESKAIISLHTHIIGGEATNYNNVTPDVKSLDYIIKTLRASLDFPTDITNQQFLVFKVLIKIYNS